ncbi:sensor histidine kinase [Cryobacterium tagatosivorans]|uniref:ATP-binding protein n=1 Tax=Cryobacterium tagatosivorans TaxID=1259199 RepID=A0A4V3I6A1_9MICO|nr:ATP-binding protein [Cryobacterium tagatosivorans]TFB47772.1 ATP-binding protein [Cryobacterium tagatosivorans]
MSLGLPGHLVQATLSRALARASHWFGLVCLTGALASVVILSLVNETTRLGLTLLSVLAMGALLVLLARHRTVPITIAYLLLGTGCVYLYTVTLLGMPGVFPASNVFLVSLPKMAMIMVGGAGSSAFVGVLWSTLGFLLAEATVLLAVLHTQVPYRPDLFTVSTYLVLVGVMLLDGFARRTGRTAQPAIHRAVRDDYARLLRNDFAHRAIARMHDTTLDQLVALARAQPGTLHSPMRASIRDTLRTLNDANWLADVDAHAAERPTGEDAWLASAVYTAIDGCRDRGLMVEVSGDRSALGRLGPDADRELGLAVRQCLVNVIQHAGIVAAEVIIDADDDSVSVMVQDAGRGFTESESGPDRLGLRQSVRRRIERLGGSVAVLSRPGAGTSVLLTLPAAPPSAAAAERDERVAP